VHGLCRRPFSFPQSHKRNPQEFGPVKIVLGWTFLVVPHCVGGHSFNSFRDMAGRKGVGVEFLEGLWNTHTFSESVIDQRNINTIRGIVYTMSHTIKDKEKLVLRARRIQGQVEALARALEEERDCSDVLQLMSAARGAMNSLMAELLEGHIRNHVLNEKKSNAGQTSAAEEVIKMVRSYLK